MTETGAAARKQPEFLTTRELAELLRIKERKVYDLAASGEIPCSRALGKLLFSRAAIDAWLARHSAGPHLTQPSQRPNIMLGSHDPLLDWALRESQSGLAAFFDGSFDGLDRFANGEGIATGLHVHDAASGTWNVPAVRARLADARIVLIEWAWRARGLIVARGSDISGLTQLRSRSVVPRQPGSGSQSLLMEVLHTAGLEPGAVSFIAPARTESDAALAVQDGKADAAFGLAAMARQYRLDFVPVTRERYDLVVERRTWFEPPMQRLIEFGRSAAHSAKAAELGGYDVSDFGRIHYNAP